jgi:hypothetical protein
MSEQKTSKYYCKICKSNWDKKGDYDRHVLTKKHKKMAACENSFEKKTYACKICEIRFLDKYELIQHLYSKQHIKIFKNHFIYHNLNTADRFFLCPICCNKSYDVYHSYWSHIKKCEDVHDLYVTTTQFTKSNNIHENVEENSKIVHKVIGEPIVDLSPRGLESAFEDCKPLTQGVRFEIFKGLNIIENDEKKDEYLKIINKLVSENQELRNFVVEQSKEHNKETLELVNKVLKLNKSSQNIINNQQINNNNTNTINGNITSNKFNINVFLNDKCKDALNLREFIDTVEITNKDLENNAIHGFVGGISKIIIENLKNLSIYERPIHCTDVKRETIYIKDEDQWAKEEDTKKLCQAIQEISRKSLVQFCKWKEDNPDYTDLDSDLGNKYIAISRNSIAGNNREEYYGKVIKAITKETTIDKKTQISE